jgi:hypothetical protein
VVKTWVLRMPDGGLSQKLEPGGRPYGNQVTKLCKRQPHLTGEAGEPRRQHVSECQALRWEGWGFVERALRSAGVSPLWRRSARLRWRRAASRAAAEAAGPARPRPGCRTKSSSVRRSARPAIWCPMPEPRRGRAVGQGNQRDGRIDGSKVRIVQADNHGSHPHGLAIAIAQRPPSRARTRRAAVDSSKPLERRRQYWTARARSPQTTVRPRRISSS